jgi:hypothetical protein
MNLGNKPKSVKHVSEGGRVGKKKGMDAKQLRPKADQAVSSVSAAPALVHNIRLAAQLKGRLSCKRWLWSISPTLCFGGHLRNSARQKISCISWHQICILDTYRIPATRSGVLDLVTGPFPLDAHLTCCLERHQLGVVLATQLQTWK